MSQLKVDTITDEAGTGAPNFPNGIELSGSPFVPPTANFQEFTSSGTWTKPAGASFVYVECLGAGGSGEVNRGDINTAYGGNGGTFSRRLLLASDVGSTVTVTIGAGAAAVVRTTNGTTNGNSGGNTTFGSLLTGSGGLGGSSAQLRNLSGASGESFGQGNGNTLYGGGGGAHAFSVGGTAGGTSILHGNGGASAYGTGNQTATAGSAPSGGGGAATTTNTAGTTTSGAGARGEVRVWAW
jgi:hypothetical protein